MHCTQNPVVSSFPGRFPKHPPPIVRLHTVHGPADRDMPIGDLYIKDQPFGDWPIDDWPING